MVEEYIVKHQRTDNGESIGYVQPIVRCKDCKWYVQNRMFQCGAHCIPVKNPDWFCADGERL